MDRTPKHNPPPPPSAAPLAFGDLLRRHRIAAGWSQEELAERAAVSARAISNYENGTTLRPQRETVRLLSEALGLTEAEQARFVAASRAGAWPVSSPPAAIPVASTASPTHLPVPLAPLLSRERELKSLTALLGREDVRLVTLLGPGGVGKTRLALAAAAAARTAYADGAYFVSLAPIREPEVLLLAVAQALGVASAGKQTQFDALCAWLHERRVLLVLDNFEHLLSEAVVVANLLLACPGLVVLATSREPLRLRGEREYSLSPLETGAGMRAVGVAESPAAAVFAHYARAVRPGFEVTAENAGAVEAICARLDGLPLALELAAAQIRWLTPAQQLERLSTRLPILVNGPRDAPVRHQGLAAAIAWSHDLLTADERRIFRRLAVFAGGWSLEAAESVCGEAETTSGTILTALESLVMKNLVQLAPRSETPRFTMLETIREYAQERLAASGEAEGVGRAHAAHFRALVDGANQALIGPEQMAVRDRIDRDYDNLRGALRWSIEHGAVEWAGWLGWELWRYWSDRVMYTEGRGWLREILALEGVADHPCYFWLHFAAGVLAMDQGDDAAARASLERGLSLAPQYDTSGPRSAALTQLGRLAYRQGDSATARVFLEESLAIRRCADDRWDIGVSLLHLSRVLLDLGDYATTGEMLQEALAIARESADTTKIGECLHQLGRLAIAQREYDRARAFLLESLAFYRATTVSHTIATCLEDLARVAVAQGVPVEAVHLLGAAAALRDRDATPLPPVDRPAVESTRAVTRAALAAEVWEAAWKEGQQASLPESIAAAQASPAV
jgi:predicted ATPase/transcriptional regulator with XRE-family HTH domain